MIHILGNEFDFSFTDADNMQRWAEAQENVREKHKALVNYQASAQEYDIKEYSELLRNCCQAIADLFDGVLGEGSAVRIFGHKSDFETCIDAYQEFQDEFVKQTERLSAKVNRFKPVGEKGKK